MTTFLATVATRGHGPSLGIKDCIDVEGLPTTAASRALADARPAASDAPVVARARAAGYEVAGKLNMHELAFGVTGINDFTGTPANALDPTLIPGGSSSGSAVAVASGLVDVGLGTDTGGSVRVPAACNGIVGFKPGYGALPRDGVLPTVSTLDCVGPLTRTVDDALDFMSALGLVDHESPADEPASLGLLDLPAAGPIAAAVREAAFGSGLPVVELPGQEGLLRQAFSAGLQLIGVEAWAAWRDVARSGTVGSDVARRLVAASRISERTQLIAERTRCRFARLVDDLLGRVDVLAMPTLPMFPPTVEQARTDPSATALTVYVRPFNLSGHPAVALPAPADAPLPASVQLVGRRGSDLALLRTARRFETTLAAERNVR